MSAPIKKKVLFIIYDLERGGPEMRLLDFAKYFPNDIALYICVLSNNISLLPEFKKYRADIRVIPVKRAYLEFKNIKKIHDYIKKNEITIINTFDIKGLFISVLAKLFFSKQISIIHHVVDLLHNYSSRQKKVLWILLKSIDLVLCNSNQARKIIQDEFLPVGNVKVIHNGVDETQFKKNLLLTNPLKEQYGIKDTDTIIGTIANFRKVKNYPLLIDAFSTLTAKYPALKLLCVGGGAYIEEIKKKVREYHLTERVIFTGYSSDVNRFLEMMDIFVLCSLAEGFPNVIIQAMCMGVPVVSTAVGGCPEIIEHGRNGLLFPSNHKEKFVQNVSKLIDDKPFASELVQQGKKTVQDKFLMKTMIKNYSRLFREM